MDSYVKKLISEGEHLQLDFKFEISDSKKIARTIVAFANTMGGRILIGVKDNGNISGIRTSEEFYMVEAAAKLYCYPPIQFHLNEWSEEGKTVLEIVIPKSIKQRHKAPDKNNKLEYFIRVNDSIFIANGVIKKVWKKQEKKEGVKICITDKEKRLLNYLKINSYISLNKFKKLSGYSYKKCEHVLANFIILKVININFSNIGINYSIA